MMDNVVIVVIVTPDNIDLDEIIYEQAHLHIGREEAKL
jgi:hypothetical protein